ncbi:MAG: hypothetical protein BWX70_01492 [Verrucomicrobia bacterium ADurb.Bin070]|nr:MAG: hypothetical protein BWX70_01492 [Verrucomicrobia bacterium ADurb.Bin070]
MQIEPGRGGVAAHVDALHVAELAAEHVQRRIAGAVLGVVAFRRRAVVTHVRTVRLGCVVVVVDDAAVHVDRGMRRVDAGLVVGLPEAEDAQDVHLAAVQVRDRLAGMIVGAEVVRHGERLQVDRAAILVVRGIGRRVGPGRRIVVADETVADVEPLVAVEQAVQHGERGRVRRVRPAARLRADKEVAGSGCGVVHDLPRRADHKLAFIDHGRAETGLCGGYRRIAVVRPVLDQVPVRAIAGRAEFVGARVGEA